MAQRRIYARVWLDPQPLRRIIEGPEGGGWRAASRAYARRHRVAPASAERSLARVFADPRGIEANVADRWAVALDLHPAQLWGERFYGAPVRLAEDGREVAA